MNGFGPESGIASLIACTAPSGLSAPYFISSTGSSQTIGWTTPADEGGCPITGYAVFRDDGVTMNPTIEVNVNNDPAVRDIPTLR